MSTSDKYSGYPGPDDFDVPFERIDPQTINPGACTDLEWYLSTRLMGEPHCGGCGDTVEHCHPGHACGNLHVVDPMREGGAWVCDLCPHRVATGQVLVRRVVM